MGEAYLGGGEKDLGLKRAGLVFGGFARYFQRVLPDFEPFPPDFLQDFTQLPSKSLSLLLGEGNWGGEKDLGLKRAVRGLVWCLGLCALF